MKTKQDYKIQLFKQKILIIKLQYVGDTMSVVPVVAALKRHAPELTVDVLIHKECAELITYDTNIRKVWIYDRNKAKSRFFSTIAYHLPLIVELRREKYDIVIALTQADRAFFLSFATGAPLRLTYDIQTFTTRMMNAFAQEKIGRRHFIEIDVDILQYFSIETRNIELHIPMPDTIKERISGLLATTTNTPLVAIHPGARKKMRQWKLERFAEIAQRLNQQYGAKIVLLGGGGELDLLEQIEQKMGFAATLKSCDLSLLDVAAIFSVCCLFIGNDSGPGHIAAAVDCPTLSLFGPNYPIICRPYNASGKVIFKNLDCCGCRQEEHLCIRPKNTCMDLIEVDEVWLKVQEMLSGNTVIKSNQP